VTTGTIYDTLKDAGAKKNLAPHIQMIIARAKAVGMDPNFAIATAVAESRGDPKAIGDHGKSVGMWQIKQPYAKDWGMEVGQRADPVASTHGVMPKLAGLLHASGGDWAIARAMYMRGPRSKEVRALQAGEAPEKVFANDAVALSQFRLFRQMGQGSAAPAPKKRSPPIPEHILNPPVTYPPLPPMASADPLGLQGVDPMAAALPVGYYARPTPPAPMAPTPSTLAALGIDPFNPEALWQPDQTA
jgi:hypothetical protein